MTMIDETETRSAYSVESASGPYYVVTYGRRSVLVHADEDRNQCTVPNTEGGLYFVRGVGELAARLAGQYALRFGPSIVYTTVAAAHARADELSGDD